MRPFKSEPIGCDLLSRRQSQNWRTTLAGARIKVRSEPEPELISPSLNWSRPKYPRLELIKMGPFFKISGSGVAL